MLVQVAITSVLWDGFTVATVDGTTLNDSDKSKLLDKYNSYSGFVSSVVAMPFGVFMGLLLPVFLFCFATHWVIDENANSIGQLAQKFVAIGIAWLLSQGLNSINVQFESPKFTFAITESDLVATDVNATTAFAMSTVTSTVSTSGHSSTDTILRSSISSQVPNPQSTCLGGKEDAPEIPFASTIYGYSSPSWIGSLLPESIASQSSVAFSTTTTVTEVDESAFPGEDVNRSAVLFSYAFDLLLVQFTDSTSPYYGSDMIYDQIKTTDGVELLQKIQKTMANATNLVAFNTFSSASMWLNISFSEITMEFSTVQLAPQIKFEAITFELSLSMRAMAGYFGQKAASSFSVSLLTRISCSDNACVLETPNAEGTFQDQVRIFRICQQNNESNVEDTYAFGVMACNSISNSSALIYSLARRISADE